MKAIQKLKEMNTQARKMARDMIYDLDDLVQQTEKNAMLDRKLRQDSDDSDLLDYDETLDKLALANKHLKLARELLSDVDEETKK